MTKTTKISIRWKIFFLNMIIKFCEGGMAASGVLFVACMVVVACKWMGMK